MHSAGPAFDIYELKVLWKEIDIDVHHNAAVKELPEVP